MDPRVSAIVDTTTKRGIKEEVKQVNVGGSLKGTDTIYMSNNINPWTVMPLSPNQVNGQTNTPTVRANFIVPFTAGNTIQVNGNMNIGGTVGAFTTFTFQYRNQSIYPYTIYDFTNSVFATTSIVGSTPTFAIGFAANQGTVDYTSGGVIFNTENVGSYSMRLNGGLGINTDPGVYALNINGSAKVSGALDIGSVTVTTLGIGTSVAPGYVFDVSGFAQFRNTITALQDITAQGTITANTLLAGRQLQTTLDANIGTSLLVNSTTQLAGNVGIGRGATGYALDVSGSTNVSDTVFMNNANIHNNVDLSGNLFIANQISNPSNTGNVGIGTPAIALNGFNNSLSVAGNVTVQQNTFLNQKLAIGETPTFTFGTNSFYVNGNSQMAGTFTVGSVPSNHPSIFNGDVTITGTLNQTGGSSQASADISGNLTVGGTSLLKGPVTMYSTLDVSGSSRLTGNVGIHGSLDVSGSSLFTGNVGLSGNLDVSGSSLFTGNVGLSGNLDVSGTALITGNLNYNVATERITYQLTAHQSTLPVGPGYWEASGNRINLYMPIQPTMYIIDGSTGSTVDLSVNFVTPLPYTQPIGMTYTFVARNTTGAGHRLLYPYDTGVHSTTLIPTPISTTVVRIGQNNYSSTS